MGKLTVLKSGPLTTIQDKGRFGYRQFGIPRSGAMDTTALKHANELTGNDPFCPVVEHTLLSLTLEVEEETVIAVAGAEAPVKLNGAFIAMNCAHLLKRGDHLSILPPLKGVYTYLGIGGLLKAKIDFGSASTYALAHFGGLTGSALKPGDELITKRAAGYTKRMLPEPKVPKYSPQQTIRILEGPESAYLKTGLEAFDFKVDASGNRTGIRLNGVSVESSIDEMASSAVVPGTIQLPAGGEPIVLMNDCQTTGGYPRIGKVIDADLGRTAQVRAGQGIRFRKISIEEARALASH